MDRIEMNVQTGEVKIIVEEPVSSLEIDPVPAPELELEPTTEPEPVPE